MKNLNVFEIFKSSQFAFIKGNRPTDEKAIKAKKDSLCLLYTSDAADD